MIQSVVVVDGVEFLPVKGADTGFARFVFGKCGNNGPLARSTFLAELRDRRTQASLAAVMEAHTKVQDNLFGDDGGQQGGPRAKKRQRRMSLEAKERGDLPHTVSLAMPDLRDETGTKVMSARDIKARSDLDRMGTLWIQVDAGAIDYIRHGVLIASGRTSPQPDIPKADGVRWKADRKCFIANCTAKFKTFRPAGDDPDSVRASFELAKAWVAEQHSE